MKTELNDMFLELYRLHRRVSTMSSAESQLIKTMDGVTLIVYEFGREHSDRKHVYHLTGKDDEQTYKEAVEHLNDVLKERYIA